MLQPGRKLQGRYVIVKLLGSGGMGAVYEANDNRLDKVCVVKEMFPPVDPVQAKVMAKAFEREGKTLASLNHSNLPRVTDYFTEGANYYLAMDLIRGQSLEKQIGTQGLPEAVVMRYADQLLGVLEYIHAQGILHRDIKPANIIVRPDGNCVLVDFGLVKVVGGQTSSYSMRALTPHYAPPEQYKGGTDARSDLYSLAATLYQALSGVLPTSASDQFSGDALQPLAQLRPDISQNTVRVVEKTLLMDRNKRCQSAVEMRAALKDPGAAVVDESKVGPAVGESVLTSYVPPHQPKVIPSVGASVLTFLPPSPTDRPSPQQRPNSNLLVLTLAPNVTLDLVHVPAGAFLMGSTDADKSANPSEKPQHKVMLDEYLIGKYAVTNAQYAAFVKAKSLSWSMPQGKEKHPVVRVSWDDAVAFCAWASQTTGRKVTLPTEAQWEKSARGTDGRIYPWGNEAPNANLANFNNNEKGTTVVGKYSPTGDSPYGLSDTAGNVWEWVADWYDDIYYASSPASNPQGPTTGQYRVLRGGSWYNGSDFVRAANRDGSAPIDRADDLGFRVVVSAPGS